MPHNVAFHQGLHCLSRKKRQRQKYNFFSFKFLTDMYNGLSQVRRKNPLVYEGLIHLYIITKNHNDYYIPRGDIISRLLNDRMLNIWLNNKKTIPPGRESKTGECHATEYAFLHMWYKFEVRKFSRFVRFAFRVK